MLDILDRKLQLHEWIDIMYVVTGYEATFFTMDGNEVIARSQGNTIIEALQNLEPMIKGFERK